MSAPVMMDFAEAAATLFVKESWLRRAVAADAVPHHRLGRKVRFTQSDIDQIVDEAARSGRSEVGALRTSKASR